MAKATKGRVTAKKVAAPQPAAPADAAPAKPKTKVLLVDDHPIVRERLAELIHQEPDLAVSGEAEDANQALAAVKASPPDIAIVDITLKDTYGIELIKQLK